MVKRVRRPKGRFLENGPHTVKVTTVRVEDGRTGRRYIKDKEYVLDRVLVQPAAGNALKAAETRTGLKALDDESTVNIIGYPPERWPGSDHSYITIMVGPPGMEGWEFQQAGSANKFGASPMTAHFKVRCDRLYSEAK